MADSQILSELVDIAVDTYQEGMSDGVKQNIIQKALDKASESGLTPDEIQNIEKTLQEILNNGNKLSKEDFKAQLSQKVFESINITTNTEVQIQDNATNDQVLQDLVETAVTILEQSDTKDVAQSKDEIVKATVEKATQNGIAQEDIAKIEEGIRKVLESYDETNTANNTFTTDSFKTTLSNELAPVVQNSSISFNNTIEQNNNGQEQDLTAINNEIDQFNSVMENEPVQNEVVVFNNIENALNFDIQIQNNSQNEDVKNTEDVQISEVETIIETVEEKAPEEEVDVTPPTPAVLKFDGTGYSNIDGITNNLTVNVENLEGGAKWEYSLNGGSSWQFGSGTSFELVANTTYAKGDIQVRQTDSSGNTSEVTSSDVEVVTDTVNPTVTSLVLSDTSISESDDTSSVTATITFSENMDQTVDPTVGHNATTTLTNGSGEWTSATTYVVTYTVADANVELSEIIFGVSDAKDLAGNTQDAAIELSSTPSSSIDTVVPTVTITDNQTGVADDSETDVTYTFTFSEAVTGFDTSDITVTGATKGTFTAVSDTEYTLVVTADDDSTSNISVTVAENVASDASGNTNDQTANTAQTVDTTNPTVTITDDQSGTVSDTNNVVSYTATFSEAVIGFTVDDLTVSGGTVSNFAGSGTTYTFDVTATDDSTANITVDITGSAAVDSNANVSIEATQSVQAVDTVNPTVSSVVFDDTALKVGETSTVTITFSEAVTNFDNTDITLNSGTLSAVSSSDNGVTWTATFTPTDDIEDATNIISVGTSLTDLAGNTPLASKDSDNFTVDTKEPVINSVVFDDTALKVGETSTVTITFSEAVTNFDNTDITLNSGTLSAVSSSDNGVTWTATFTPTDDIEDATNIISVGTSLTDLAGNAPLASKDSANFTVDTKEATVSSVALTSDSDATYSTLNAGDSVTATVTMSEVVSVTGSPTLTLVIGTTEVQATYNATNSTSTTLSFDYTILDSQTDTDGISIKANSLTAGTSIQDLAGNDATLTFSAITDNDNYKVDTKNPTVATTTPISKDDLDNSNDYSTNDTITIKFSENVDATSITIANITVSNSHTLGTSTISPTTGYSDTYTITLSSDATVLPTDTLTISSANIVDEAGNASTSDAVFTLPAFIPTVSSVALSATGAQNSTLNAGDVVTVTVTMSSAVDVTGTPKITLNIGGTYPQASYASGTGTDTLTFTYTIDGETASDTDGISIDANSLSLNSGTIKIKDGDVDANLDHTALSDDSDYKVDTTAPTANFTAATDDVGTITGALSSGDKTDDTSLVLSGTCEAGSTVEVFNGVTRLGSATIDGTSWTYTATVADGTTYNFNVKETDAAGNESSATSNFTVIGDTTAPTLSSSTPADDATAVAIGGDLTLTFSEAVYKGTGNIIIYNTSVSENEATISVDDITGWGTNTLTINPSSDLTAENNFAVKIDDTAITDEAGNTYAGISDTTTLNFQTAAAVTTDTSIVVFDLVGGTSSDHSSRTFDANTSYTIYIQVDSDAKGLFTDANSGNGTWGTWSSAANLGSDDKIVLVGDGSAVVGASSTIVTQGNNLASFMYQWRTSGNKAAVKLVRSGKLSRFVSDAGVGGNTVDLWSGTWAGIGNSSQTSIQSSLYKTTMPAGIMTSQGLA